MNAVLLRRVVRWFHIFVGLFVGAYFYSPLPDLAWSKPFIQFILLPLLALSGLVLWQQGRIMKFLKRVSAS